MLTWKTCSAIQFYEGDNIIKSSDKKTAHISVWINLKYPSIHLSQFHPCIIFSINGRDCRRMFHFQTPVILNPQVTTDYSIVPNYSSHSDVPKEEYMSHPEGVTVFMGKQRGRERGKALSPSGSLPT